MKSISCLVIFCFCFGFVQWAAAQDAKLLRANKKFRELDYQGAIELYSSVIAKSPEPDALFNISESYRKIGDSRNAEYWYSQAVLHPEAPAETFYYYGMALLSEGKPELALAEFQKYLELAPDQARAENQIRACRDSVRRDLMNAGILNTVTHLADVSSKFDDFGPTFYKDGFIFCSERDTGSVAFRRSAWTGRPFVDMFYTTARLIDDDKREYKYGKVEEFSNKLKTRLHDGPACVVEMDQGTEIYFTRNNIVKGKMKRDMNGTCNLQIFGGKRDGDSWTDIEPVDLGAGPEFSVAHPTVTKDGDKMFFASDMSGGFGGMDIYVSYYEGGDWSAAINLGPEINTEGDEIFPFIAENGKLYFSSDGHTGLGGLDVYWSKAHRGIWEPVENIGYPINSPKDDYSFVIDSAGTLGYFASNRDGGKGYSDLYSFTRLIVDVEILVFDKITGEGISDAKLTTPCFPKKEFVTNVDGKIYLQLPIERECTFSVESEEYGTASAAITSKGFPVGANIFEQIPMQASELEFHVEGTVRDRNGDPISRAEVSLLSSCGTEEKATTFSNGSYEFKAEGGCCYMVRVSKEGYFTSIDTFCTKGKLKPETFETNITMPKFWDKNTIENIDTGSGSVFLIDKIYFPYGESDVNVDKSPGLKDLYNLMQANPDLAVEIRSHTDSRSSEKWNFELSVRRARSVANHLIDNGISEDRVSYKGFGESQIINGCVDGVDCNESQHRINRRTEFRIYRLSSN